MKHRTRDYDPFDTYEPSEDELKKPTEPVDAFRGLWIPAELCELVAKRTIKPQEAYLIATIDRFIGAKGVGCWASDERITGRRVRTMLRHLIELRLVWKVPSDKYSRLLMTVSAKLTIKKTKR
jgi:hypothetical protein